jgi:hypothetical protein
MPWAEGQDRANSGVYLQGRYEIQLLDSSGRQPSQVDDCGAIYKVAAPLRNACALPEQWQSFDVAFRAPIVAEDGAVQRPGLVTVFHNGMLIHHAVELWKPTGGGLDEELASPGPLMLQDHGAPVRFRNVWLLPQRTAE